MSRYVRHAWWHRGLPALSLLVAVPCAGVAVHEHRSAAAWRALEKEREQVASAQVVQLRSELGDLRARATAAEGRVSELADVSAARGDRSAQLQLLAERAAETEDGLARCAVSRDVGCAESMDEALSLLRALQRLDEA